MRTSTHIFLTRLPARKCAALLLLCMLVCGGLIAGGSTFS